MSRTDTIKRRTLNRRKVFVTLTYIRGNILVFGTKKKDIEFTYPANEITDPSKAIKSSIYSTSRPQKVAKYKRVGLRSMFADEIFVDKSICNRAGDIPLLPNKPGKMEAFQ